MIGERPGVRVVACEDLDRDRCAALGPFFERIDHTSVDASSAIRARRRLQHVAHEPVTELVGIERSRHLAHDLQPARLFEQLDEFIGGSPVDVGQQVDIEFVSDHRCLRQHAGQVVGQGLQPNRDELTDAVGSAGVFGALGFLEMLPDEFAHEQRISVRSVDDVRDDCRPGPSRPMAGDLGEEHRDVVVGEATDIDSGH